MKSKLIQDFIGKLDIKKDFDYFTRRKVDGGLVIVAKLKEKEKFDVEYVCPVCKKQEIIQKDFKRKPYRFSCSQCGYKFKITKLKK